MAGVNIYEDISLQELRECKPDVVDTWTNLKDSPRWFWGSATLLYDALPKKAAIRDAIRAHAGTFGPEDLFLLVFSGHGTNDGDKGYLIPYDGLETDSYISGEELKSWLTDLIKPGEHTNICVILDSCFSGNFIGKHPGGMTSKFVPIPGSRLDFKGDDPVKQIQEMPDAVVITASEGTEYSLTAPEFGHSLCMNFLIEGLGPGRSAGPADTDHDGRVSMSELKNYAYPRVVDQSLNEQHPQFYKGANVVEYIKF